jgi:parvulin-like peptidyl-prolyl isomerase
MAVLVNGERIEDSLIHKEAERLRADYDKAFMDMPAQEREAQLLDWSRENVIERTLLRQEVKNNEPEIPEEQLESIIANLKKECKDPGQLYKEFEVQDDEDLKKSVEIIIRTERKLEKLLKDLPKPSNTDIRQYYQQNRERFRSGDQVRAAHIVKYINWQTDELVAYQAIHQADNELKQGAPFETVLEKYTDCKESGGDLGVISRGRMVEEFEDVVFNLGVGQISEVFRTRFGFHIVKVYERYPPATLGLEKVKDQITDILEEQIRQDKIYEFIDGLKQKAKIQEI